MILYNNKNIMISSSQQASTQIHKKTPKFEQGLSNIDPGKKYNYFYKLFKNKNIQLINTYLQMVSMKKQDYFPAYQIDHQTIKIISEYPLFSARAIFLRQKFRLSNKEIPSQFQKVFNSENKVYACFDKLPKIYQQRYLVDIGFIKKMYMDFSIGQSVKYQNYKYYSDNKISQLHGYYKNYKYLQDRHDYIQWMFPNHFQSMFNWNSYPMSYLQVQHFRKSSDLGRKLLKSIHIFFDFLGIVIKFDLQILTISEDRLDQALIKNCHNHLRLRRILACLSITGFRPIALKLIQFLRNLKEKPRFSKIQYAFEREWEIYGDANKQKALSLCFHPQNQFPQSHKVLLDQNNFDLKKVFPQKQNKKQQDQQQETKMQQQKKDEVNTQEHNPSIASSEQTKQNSIQIVQQISKDDQKNQSVTQKLAKTESKQQVPQNNLNL